MKKPFKPTLFVLSIFMILFSCKNDTNNTTKETTGSKHNCPVYDEINFASGGHFLNLNIGDSRETVKEKMKSMPIADEDDGAVWFKKNIGTFEYSVDTYFEDEALYSVDVFVYFYDNDFNVNTEDCKALYADWKKDFTAKYGAVDELEDDKTTYSVWDDGNVEFEVGYDEDRTYIYSYKID
ncbi:MAG: hypothetical protein H6578_03270 [Chitinophagales bacterium]|nr:hypothetical protein [Chitinophagales bacterium]